MNYRIYTLCVDIRVEFFIENFVDFGICPKSIKRADALIRLFGRLDLLKCAKKLSERFLFLPCKIVGNR